MSTQSELREASAWAEQAVTLLADARHHAGRKSRSKDQRRVGLVYSQLNEMYRGMWRHCNVIFASRDDFARVSDGVVEHFGLTGTKSFPSAHEAIAEICQFAYHALMQPLEGIKEEAKWMSIAEQLLTERADSLAVDSSSLRARIAIERARLLPKPPPPLKVTYEMMAQIASYAAAKRVAKQTIKNWQLGVKPVEKRGTANVYLYADWVKNWPDDQPSLPGEEEAREIFKNSPQQN